MAKALKERSVQKYYRCIVKGTVKEASYLKGYLQKDESSNQVLIRRTKPSEGEWLPIPRRNINRFAVWAVTRSLKFI